MNAIVKFIISLFAFLVLIMAAACFYHIMAYWLIIIEASAFCIGYFVKSLVDISDWINIDFKLPEEMDIVLFKFTIDGYSDPEYRSTGYVLDKIPILDFDGVDIDRMEVTHWKKVN